jgi:hypothetical protein
MAGTINFLIFWAVFLGLYFWLQSEMNISALSGSGFSGNIIESIINFFNLSSPYGLINAILVTPLLIVSIYLGICVIRGIPPV